MFDRLLGRLLFQIFDEWLSEKSDVIRAQLKQINDTLEKNEEIMSALAEKIKALIAVETAEGQALQDANTALAASLAAANEKIAALESAASAIPELSAQIEALKADMALADEAANAIANINPTPVADGIIEEVVENPDVSTPPVVEEAPAPAPEAIPDVPVVEAAVDALDGVG
jgi:predicted nuclease with TOPRIM domain